MYFFYSNSFSRSSVNAGIGYLYYPGPGPIFKCLLQNTFLETLEMNPLPNPFFE